MTIKQRYAVVLSQVSFLAMLACGPSSSIPGHWSVRYEVTGAACPADVYYYYDDEAHSDRVPMGWTHDFVTTVDSCVCLRATNRCPDDCVGIPGACPPPEQVTVKIYTDGSLFLRDSSPNSASAFNGACTTTANSPCP